MAAGATVGIGLGGEKESRDGGTTTPSNQLLTDAGPTAVASNQLPMELSLLTFGHQWNRYPRTLRTFDIRALHSPKGANKGRNGLDPLLQDALLKVPGAPEMKDSIVEFAEKAISGKLGDLDLIDERYVEPSPVQGPTDIGSAGPSTSFSIPPSPLFLSTNEIDRTPTPDTGSSAMTAPNTPDPGSSMAPSPALPPPPPFEPTPWPAIGIMCDHGRHRSVAMAELVAKALAEKGITVKICHRDVARGKTDREKDKTEKRKAKERLEREERKRIELELLESDANGDGNTTDEVSVDGVGLFERVGIESLPTPKEDGSGAASCDTL